MALDPADISSMPIWWPGDINLGLFFFILGLAGAAIMVYLADWEKLLGKSATIVDLRTQIEDKKIIADKIKDPYKGDERKKWEDMINEDEKILYKERNRAKMQEVFLYVFIGGIMGCILANNMLEAVAFGAGWTGLIGMFGIKKDNDVRREKRRNENQESIDLFEKTILKEAEEAFYKGYYNAVEEIAKIRKINIDELIDQL